MARELTERFPELDVKVNGCVKKCKICKEQPFVIVGGLLITGETWEEIKIKLEHIG